MEEIEKLCNELYKLCVSEKIDLNIQISVFPLVFYNCRANKKIFFKSDSEVK